VGARAEAERAAALASGEPLGRIPAGAALPRAGAVTLADLPAGFSLRAVATSHSWCALPPFAYEPRAGVLHRTLRLPDAGPITVSVRHPSDLLVVSWGRRPGTAADRLAVAAVVRRMLAVDSDLTELYDVCDAVEGFGWVREEGLGRLLRSPTVWEDAVRTLATTNTSFTRTRALITRLVEGLGPAGPGGERAFPEPAAVAEAGERYLRDVARAGYRSEPMARFAAAVAGGRVDPEAWRDPSTPDDRVRHEISRLAGFGPFATDTLFALLGRPRGLTLDAWAARRVGELAGLAAPADEAAAAHRYKPFGRWAGTVCWLELTRMGAASPPGAGSARGRGPGRDPVSEPDALGTGLDAVLEAVFDAGADGRSEPG
jgi:3-methyladenine DNA glycosylase/8-oxoguanine DNA glycosylase